MNHIQFFEELIQILINEGGSDIHFSEGRFPTIRVSGELITLSTMSQVTREQIVGILESILIKEHFDHFIQVQELDFSYNYRDTNRLRGNAFVQQGKIGVVFRLIPEIKTLEELGLPPVLADFSRRKQGFFLVVGPVGQGKSSTLASMVDNINRERSAHIITIEDPIEYVYSEQKSIIDQREVGTDTADFQSALRSSFRQDVNVILIGEMRNPETIATAITAAETGHLVMSTLHTNNASQTIDRIIDSFPADQQDQIRTQLASSLIGIFSQRLIPRISGGRVVAYELLINNTAVSNLIREKRTHEIDMVIETGLEHGMVDMNRVLVDLVRAGEITVENAYSHSINPKNLQRLM